MNKKTKIKLIKEAESFLGQAVKNSNLCRSKPTDYSSYRYEIGYYLGRIDVLTSIKTREETK